MAGFKGLLFSCLGEGTVETRPPIVDMDLLSSTGQPPAVGFTFTAVHSLAPRTLTHLMNMTMLTLLRPWVSYPLSAPHADGRGVEYVGCPLDGSV